MKIIIPVLLSVLVGVGTTPYVYGFKKAFSENPLHICRVVQPLLWHGAFDN